MKMKFFGLTETKLFQFYRVFKTARGVEGEGDALRSLHFLDLYSLDANLTNDNKILIFPISFEQTHQ